MEILYHTSIKYTSLWIAQFIKKWISAHPQEGEHDVILPSWRHSGPALPMAVKPPVSHQPLALETCFPLQRMVVLCSPPQEPSLCTPLQRRLLPARLAQKSLGDVGPLGCAGHCQPPPHPAPDCHPDPILPRGKSLKLGHNKQLILLQFSASPDLDISMSLPVTQHVPSS